MAIAVVNRVSINGDYAYANSTIPFALNCNGATLLVIGIFTTDGSVTSMTYGGAAMTQIGSAVLQSGLGGYIQNFYLKNPATGTNDIVGAVTSSAGYCIGEAVCLTGEDATTPIGASVRGGTSGVNYTLPAATITSASSLLLGFVTGYYPTSTTTVIPPSGWTMDHTTTTFADSWCAAISKNPSGATGSYALPWQLDQYSHMGTSLVEIIPATGGSSGQSVTLLGITSTAVLGLPAIVPGDVSRTAQGIGSTSALGLPGVGIGGISVTLQGIPSSSAAGLPYIGALQNQGFEVKGIASQAQLGNPVITANVALSILGIPSEERVGLASIPWPQEFLILGSEPVSEVGLPVAYVNQTFAVTSIENLSKVGLPAASWPHYFTAAGVPKSSRLGRPRIRGVIAYPLVIQPGETRVIKVTFKPAGLGQRTGSLMIAATDRARSPIPLRGRGTGFTLLSIGEYATFEGSNDGSEEADGNVVSVQGIQSSSVVGKPSAGLMPELSWLTTQGRLMLDEQGREVLLRSCNYYGLEQAGVPYGVWTAPYRTITVGGVTTEGILDKIKRAGFNSIRQLVSVDMTMKDAEGKFYTARTFPQPSAWNSTFVNAALNPDLIASQDSMTGNNIPVDVITMLDRLVDHCEKIGLRMILDMHCLAADNDNIAATQGKWYTTDSPGGAPAGARWDRWIDGARRNEPQYIAAWKFYADRYKNRPVVCGFDLINEPHNSTWDRNATSGLVGIYERVGKEIHAINPNVLLICEGSSTPPEDAWNFDPSETTGEATWGSIWSGYLSKARGMLVGSGEAGVMPNKTVYSPHEYGAEAGPTGPSWFTKPLFGKNFPQNLREVWRQQWGYLAEEDIAPVWIGEYGSTWRVGDHGYTQDQHDKDAAWLARLADYCHTFRIGTAFWGFVPDFIGGLVETDYTTLRTDKLEGFLTRFMDPKQPLIEPMPVVGAGGTGGPGGDGGGGSVETMQWLKANGGHLVTEDNTPFRVKGTNWYGFDSVLMPGGLWTRAYKTIVIGGATHKGILDQIAELGFNTIRLPVCQDITWPGRKIYGTNTIDASKNPDFISSSMSSGAAGSADVLPSLVVLDKIIAYAKSLGLRVILDMHCAAPNTDNEAGFGGKWYTTATPGGAGSTAGVMGEPRNEEQWIRAWEFLANRYKNEPAVCGFDLLNEPFNCTWDNNALTGLPAALERCATRIQAINTKALIICEGIQDQSPSYPSGWTSWSGYSSGLNGVATRPIAIPVQNKLVYSPHEYPNALFEWFNDPAFPDTLTEVWDTLWGFIPKTGIAPIILGEIGGNFLPSSTKNLAWAAKLNTYTATNDISWMYWAINGGGLNTDVTEGIIGSDYNTVNAEVMAILQPMLDAP
ncbi:cellulase family glycosylhydrolase [Roseococcus sp.]|uniref:glycoside hydrolase family 5 protein n=1 Tax=Roseococcus sp. TaxID=2109646 RepID=UPI003BA8F90B